LVTEWLGLEEVSTSRSLLAKRSTTCVLEDSRMKRRIQVLFAGMAILVTLSVGGCGGGLSSERYLIWRIVRTPDGEERAVFEGAADKWAMERLRKNIVCFGAECMNGDAVTLDRSDTSGGLIAVEIPPAKQTHRMEARCLCKPLIPSYMNFPIAGLLGRVRTCLKTGRKEESVSEPAEATVADSLEAAAYCGRGAIHVEDGRYDQAVSEYSKAIEKYPQFPKALYGRGTAYYEKGEYDLALSDYAKAIELNPQFDEPDDRFTRLVREKWARSKERQRS
jgi:tetratricopeptide (TPR) repeat protein